MPGCGRRRDASTRAVAAVHAASVNRDGGRAKLDAVIAKHQDASNRADQALSKAQSHLVSVSGIERAALVVDQPVAKLRAAVRAATGHASQEPA